MPDYGTRFAEKALDTVERKVHATYRRAAEELQKKLADFARKHKAKDALMRKKVEDGLITEQSYKSWLQGQLFMEKQWKDKIDQCAKVILDANREAMDIVHNGKLDIFAENYNHSAYELEKAAGNLGFNVYNTESVSQLTRRKPSLLPKYKIDEDKDYKWNVKKVRNSVSQGIIQGESVDQITDRLVASLCTQNENKMRMFARTSVTSAQNAGRIEQMHDAEDMGINVKKRWLATLDDRTRDTHAELDGQEEPVDEPFEVDGMKIMFPGDPNAEPGMVFNCRCTLIQVYEGIDRKSVRRDDEGNLVEDMTYKEWKEAKENGTLGTNKNDSKENKDSQGIKETENSNSDRSIPSAEVSEGNEKAQGEDSIDIESVEEQKEDRNSSDLIKEAIKDHTGDWKSDDVIDVGSIVTNSIEEKTTDLREEKATNLNEIKEYNKRLKELNEQRKTLSGEALKANEEETIKVIHERSKLFERNTELTKEINRIGNEELQKTMRDVREIGGVSEDNIKQYADTSYYGYHAKEARQATIDAMNHYPKDWLDASAAHGKTLHPHWTQLRAHYDDSTGEMRVDGDIETGLHEFLHRAECAVKGIMGIEKEFYDRRTAGSKLEPLGKGFGKDEKTRRDKFVDAYMGKDYDGKAYELLSMAYQHLLSGNYSYLDGDKEMRNWAIGIILTQ